MTYELDAPTDPDPAVKPVDVDVALPRTRKPFVKRRVPASKPLPPSPKESQK